MRHGPHYQAPWESERIGIDFTDRLGSGDSVSSASITAEDENGTDVTSTIIESGTQTLSGNTVSVRVKSLTDGKKYLVRIKAITGAGDKKQGSILAVGKEDEI